MASSLANSTATLTLNAEDLDYLEDALQRDAVNFLRNDGEQGISASTTMGSEYWLQNRAMFSKVWNALYDN